MSVAEQVRVFGVMVLLGAGLCAAGAAAGLMMRLLAAGAVIRGLADLAFGAVCAAGIAAAALMLRVQAVRWYVFAGVLAGMALVAVPAAVLRAGLRRCRVLFGKRGWPKEKKVDKKGAHL